MNGVLAAPSSPHAAMRRSSLSCDLHLRHLGEKKLLERLPFICELAKDYVGVDPVQEPIPVRPTVHYTMGGIQLCTTHHGRR